MISTQELGRTVLDASHDLIVRGELDTGMERLYEGLLNLREELPGESWRRFANEIVVQHPLRSSIHRDPMTRRSFEKPRGYAGDAVLLDYIYGLRHPDPEDRLARGVYDYCVSRPAARAVRWRRKRIAERLDRIAEAAGRPIRVLSIAAGHLRELQIARCFDAGQVEEFVALDADAESCRHLEAELSGIEVRNASFTSLFRERASNGRFDFVYSAGLFDYLEDRIAKRLVRRMFELTRPGGSMLLTNFLASTVDAGYMETFMGWELIFRDRDDLIALADTALPPEQVARRDVHVDSHRSIGYLEVERR